MPGIFQPKPLSCFFAYLISGEFMTELDDPHDHGKLAPYVTLSRSFVVGLKNLYQPY